MGLRATPVVLNLIIINALFFFATETVFSEYQRALALYYPFSPEFRPYQIVTYLFMHADLRHLFFNMLMLFFMGPPVEALWGARRFLFFYFVAGFGAAAIQLGAQYVDIEYFGIATKNYAMVGASGAVMGVLVGFGMNYPDAVIQLLIPPIPLKAKYFVPILIAIDLFSGIGRLNSGIAHFAHVGGALVGFLLIVYWRKYGSRL